MAHFRVRSGAVSERLGFATTDNQVVETDQCINSTIRVDLVKQPQKAHRKKLPNSINVKRHKKVQLSYATRSFYTSDTKK